MEETIEESLINGFLSWRNNLVMGVPYILSTVMTAILLAVSAICVAMITAAASAFSQNMDGSAAPVLVLAALCISSLAAGALLSALNAYLTAGAIGMSLETALKGRTTLSDMTDYAGKRWFDIFKMNMLWAVLLIIPGIILLIPAVYAFYARAIPQGMALTFIATAAYVTYAAGVFFMYAIASTAMIVDGAGVIQGIKSAYGFSSKNKIKLSLMLFAYMGTLSLASYAWAVLTSPLGLLQLLSPGVYGIAQVSMLLVFLLVASFVVTPLYTVWLTRIYLAKGAKGPKTLHSPAPRHLNREKPGTQREIYV
jgi:hypothetical protein